MDFTRFVLQELPPAPARVLEVGCGEHGGVVPALLEAGYDAIGVDPEAPAGERFRRVDFREVDGTFDAVVAGRVLHHLFPLGEAVDRLSSLAPLLIVDEFAWDLIDPELEAWYDARRGELAEPKGPESVDEWRSRHASELHPHGVVLDALRTRYDERVLEWRPYLHRWLADDVPSPDRIGYQWAGVAKTSTTRISAESR
ncbi:MAG TPA: class I SAM-dependent methyltransferase [Gaiellaceae bacterium]|nr:class I SAM-dependent methyltransferase [Gaiellaceae bacterium]